MSDTSGESSPSAWSRLFPPVERLRGYRVEHVGGDMVAGITPAAHAVPVSLAYAAVAVLPPQVGICGYLLGGLGYALLGSSRQLAFGPT
jgi:MFS superfamily sulfate permease-like transporter